jgi:hypothetical protein
LFVGHVALGFVGKTLAPRVSLAWLVLCTQLADVLWPLFLLAGIEHARIVPGITAASPLDLYDYPYSHSAGALLVWSVLAASPWLYGRRFREAAVVFGAVFSHFVLDVISHRPDVPLVPGSPIVFGLGLWNSRVLSLLVEGALWAAGLTIYARATRATSAFGRYGLWALVALLTFAWLGGMYGPPPPSITAVALSGLIATVVFVAWLWFLDARRPLRAPSVRSGH